MKEGRGEALKWKLNARMRKDPRETEAGRVWLSRPQHPWLLSVLKSLMFPLPSAPQSGSEKHRVFRVSSNQKQSHNYVQSWAIRKHCSIPEMITKCLENVGFAEAHSQRCRRKGGLDHGSFWKALIAMLRALYVIRKGRERGVHCEKRIQKHTGRSSGGVQHKNNMP